MRRSTGLPERPPVDLQLAHAAAQGVRIDTQQARCAVMSLDPAVGCFECCLDVLPNHVVERGNVGD